MEKKPVIYAWVFARGGSKGLPGKNIRVLGGKPLIAYAIDLGNQSCLIDKVFVSTDDPDIAAVAKEYGAEVPFLRPEHLASDDAPERLAWRHAIEWVKSSEYQDMDIMVSLPTTAPLRTLEEVEEAIVYYEKGWDTVISVSPTERHPSFNMVNVENDGSLSLVCLPAEVKACRQDFRKVYNIATAFYVSSPDFVMHAESYWDGRVGAVEIPAQHAVDIDTPMDFEFAEFLLRRRSVNDEIT